MAMSKNPDQQFIVTASISKIGSMPISEQEELTLNDNSLSVTSACLLCLLSSSSLSPVET